jgi:Flp pilus assembly protein TadD
VAAALAEAGRYEEAAREVDLAVRAHPRDATLRRQAAQIHEHAGNTGKAVGYLESASRLQPSDAQTWILLGEIENRRDNAADAYIAYRHAAELAPNEIRAWSGLALAADHLGFEEEAENAYARWAVLEAELGIDTLPSSED